MISLRFCLIKGCIPTCSPVAPEDPMTTTAEYHAMIAQIADELDFYRRCLVDDSTRTHPLAERARELLAAADEPERC